MMCGKSDLLSSLWIPFTVFLCSSILMTSIYIPNRMVKENVSGDVHNHIKYIGRYDNFDSMIHNYCLAVDNKADQVMIVPFERSSCERNFTWDKGLQFFIVLNSLLVVLPFLCCIIYMVWLACIDIKNRNYINIMILCIICGSLIIFAYLYVSRYQLLTSDYFITSYVRSGNMRSYNNFGNKSKSCQFNFNDEFRDCYCQLLHHPPMSYLNTTQKSTCEYLINSSLFGLILTGLGIIGFLIIYYLSHIVKEYDDDLQNDDLQNDDLQNDLLIM